MYCLSTVCVVGNGLLQVPGLLWSTCIYLDVPPFGADKQCLCPQFKEMSNLIIEGQLY